MNDKEGRSRTMYHRHHPISKRIGGSIAATAIAALVFVTTSAATPITTGTTEALGTARAPGSAAAPALAARTISLRETGQLHLISKRGFTLYEQGPATGSVAGTLYVRLKIVSTSHVTAEVSLSPHGGSISGVASANYHKGSSSASFSGSLSITRGTGSYARAHGSNLSFTGTIQRSSDAIDAHVSGTVSV